LPGPTSLAVVAALAMLAAASPAGLELQPAASRAFDRYVALAEARIQQEISGKSPLLWIDQQPPSQRGPIVAALERGEVVSAKLQMRDRGKSIDPPGGLIHHWVGTVFLAGADVRRARTMLQDYDRYPQWFSPLIQRAHIESRSGDRFRVAMRTEMHKILTVTVDADYDIAYSTLSDSTFHVRSIATAIHIVDSPGTSAERRTPADQTFGFLWRLNTYCSFAQVANGTYEQCESISLTRDIPFGLGMIVRPLVTGIPRETLEFTLGHVRQLVSVKK